jgi:hypothetical protein
LTSIFEGSRTGASTAADNPLKSPFRRDSSRSKFLTEQLLPTTAALKILTEQLPFAAPQCRGPAPPIALPADKDNYLIVSLLRSKSAAPFFDVNFQKRSAKKEGLRARFRRNMATGAETWDHHWTCSIGQQYLSRSERLIRLSTWSFLHEMLSSPQLCRAKVSFNEIHPEL